MSFFVLKKLRRSTPRKERNTVNTVNRAVKKKKTVELMNVNGREMFMGGGCSNEKEELQNVDMKSRVVSQEAFLS